MGIREWWRRRRGAAGADRGGDDGIPASAIAAERQPTASWVGTSPGGSDQYEIHEYRHTFDTKRGPLEVRTFTTAGLEARGAAEVRISVPADWAADAVDGARLLLLTQEHFVAADTPAVLGDYTGFREPRLAGAEPIGVTYARGTEIPGIPGSAAALVAVPLHADELALAMNGMTTRILGRLARRTRFFPYPPWWELRRRPVLSRGDQARSLLERIGPRVSAGDVHVTGISAAATVRVSLPPTAAAVLGALPRDARMLVIHAHLAPDADGQYIWLDDGGGPAATHVGDRAPERVGFAFLALVAGDAPAVKVTEDGAGVILADAAFDRVLEALRTGADLSIDVDGSVTLDVIVRRDSRGEPS